MRPSYERFISEQYPPIEQGTGTRGLSRQVSAEHEPRPVRYLVLSDIHSDLAAAQATLYERGVIDRHGDWQSGVHDTHLVSTGDCHDRSVSDRHVVKYLRHLAETARHGNVVTVLLGNHELDTLALVAHGEHASLKDVDVRFLASCPLVYKAGPVLLLHGYPTRELLEAMVEQYEKEGRDVQNEAWVVNREARELLTAVLERKDVHQVSGVCQYLVARIGAGHLDESRYYEVEGEHVRDLLRRLGVTTVVHGHRRHEKGGQLIEPYLSGIHMINNDVAMAAQKNSHQHHRISAVEVEQKSGTVTATCIYKGDVHKDGAPSITETVVH